MRVLGIDVSHWEGIIEWRVTAPAIGFAYYKCTDGILYKDSRFEANKAGCIDANLSHAPYHYYQPNLSGIDQARHFNEKAGRGFKRYIVDVEEKPQPYIKPFDNWINLQSMLIELHTLTGYQPAIYTSAGYWMQYMGYTPAARNYDLLLARYAYAKNPTPPTPWTSWKVWQFTDYGFVPGCNEVVDMDWFNGDISECKRWFGGSNEQMQIPALNKV